MKASARPSLIVSIVITILVMAPASVPASEYSASSLKLQNTYLKTSNDPLVLSTSPANALTPTTVICPQPGPCVLDIEFAAQFNSLTSSAVAAAVVTVDGSTAEVSPCAPCGLDSTSTGGGSNARSYLWMAKGIQPGSHSVAVQLSTTQDSAGSSSRSLKVEVYLEKKP